MTRRPVSPDSLNFNFLGMSLITCLLGELNKAMTSFTLKTCGGKCRGLEGLSRLGGKEFGDKLRFVLEKCKL